MPARGYELYIRVFNCFAPDTAIVHTTTPQNANRKRSRSKTLSKEERFENFLETMFSSVDGER